VTDVDFEAGLDAEGFGEIEKGLSFAFFRALAVVHVQKGEAVSLRGNGGGHTTIHATADKDHGEGEFRGVHDRELQV
jgi:hypothetical protein